jgi:hypothetical protein
MKTPTAAMLLGLNHNAHSSKSRNVCVLLSKAKTKHVLQAATS